MFYTDYFLLPQQRSSNTTCGVVHMIDKCPMHTGHLADKISLFAFFLKTLTSTYFVSICVLSYVDKVMID